MGKRKDGRAALEDKDEQWAKAHFSWGLYDPIPFLAPSIRWPGGRHGAFSQSFGRAAPFGRGFSNPQRPGLHGGVLNVCYLNTALQTLRCLGLQAADLNSCRKHTRIAEPSGRSLSELDIKTAMTPVWKECREQGETGCMVLVQGAYTGVLFPGIAV